jgi:hypothetical protein
VDSSSAIIPARRTRATRHHPATHKAKAADRATARSGLPAANGAMATPVIRAIVDSGPEERIRELPRTAYAMIAARAVHKLATGGTLTMAE